MKVLVAGFEASERERISSELRSEGHHALCVGVDIAVAMAPGFGPDEVIIPPGSVGQAAREALSDVLDGVPVRTAGAAREPAPADSSSMDAGVALSGGVSAAAGETGAVAFSDPSGADGAATPGLRRPTSLTPPDMAMKLGQVRFGDYHCILEVTPGASAFLVREHYEALSRAYNPAGWPHRLTPQEVHILAEIGEGIREAFTILGHKELRARYERALARQPR